MRQDGSHAPTGFVRGHGDPRRFARPSTENQFDTTGFRQPTDTFGQPILLAVDRVEAAVSPKHGGLIAPQPTFVTRTAIRKAVSVLLCHAHVAKVLGFAGGDDVRAQIVGIEQHDLLAAAGQGDGPNTFSGQLGQFAKRQRSVASSVSKAVCRSSSGASHSACVRKWEMACRERRSFAASSMHPRLRRPFMAARAITTRQSWVKWQEPTILRARGKNRLPNGGNFPILGIGSSLLGLDLAQAGWASLATHNKKRRDPFSSQYQFTLA